jgi:predicted GNAT family acetyltransferase
MGLRVTEVDDAAVASAQADEFLATFPTQHNVLLTLLAQHRERAAGGRFWIVADGDVVVGFASHAPPGQRVALARMHDDATRALADAIDPPIPGVVGTAADAATFAGHFAERHHVPVAPYEAQRLYELLCLEAVATSPGRLRPATTSDGPVLVDWSDAFAAETHTTAGNAKELVDAALAAGRAWVWDDHGPVAMAWASKPAMSVCRVQAVYTPPRWRGSGYATACVEHLSRTLIGRGMRCVLYTQLSNPTSNAIYQRIGYRPAAEIVSYDFG